MPVSEEELKDGRMINIRLRGELLQQFEKLCEVEMRNMSDMLRYLIAKEVERRAANQMSLFPADGQK